MSDYIVRLLVWAVEGVAKVSLHPVYFVSTNQMFCSSVLAKETVVLLNINNPLSMRRRTSSNIYVLELAHSLGIPVLSWDAEYSGAQVSYL